ncbi:MAG: hypothetical protein MK109_00640 [Dehalococcoidia bacterium]|nr:hypothetical protein [Dehalococcoidia bacterium]
MTADRVITEVFGEDTDHTLGETVSVVSELAQGGRASHGRFGAPTRGGGWAVHVLGNPAGLPGLHSERSTGGDSFREPNFGRNTGNPLAVFVLV